MRFSIKLFLLLLTTSSISFASNECTGNNYEVINSEINVNSIIRDNAPKELFGFNLPWRDFQIGYFRNGEVKDELIELLSPFDGASYRYPGGSPTSSFEWRNSIGPVAQRKLQHADYDRYSIPEFGLNEFANFVTRVKGRAIITINLVGPYKKNPLSPDELASETFAMLQYIKNSSEFACVGGAKCTLMAMELGNELDGPPYNWPASIYTMRSTAVLAKTATDMPEIKWIANGRSSPWENKAPEYKIFNNFIASGLANKVQGIAIHPYYDGIDIPSASQYVTEFGKSWQNFQPKAQVFVTEHARWPTIPVSGEWKSNWSQATGLGGAISTADFLLTLMRNPQVAAANWHALGISGPWQLIRLDKKRDRLYPSPVYWGMRTIREGYLDHVVSTVYTQPSSISYSGGYDFKLVGMTTKDGKSVSVLGINRNIKPINIHIKWTGGSRKAGIGILKIVTGNSTDEDNTDTFPDKIIIKKNDRLMQSNRSTSSWCIPGQSIFSIIEP